MMVTLSIRNSEDEPEIRDTLDHVFGDDVKVDRIQVLNVFDKYKSVE